ncbi:MAG: SDR family NAD(P)-dependent oxidoreductase, partial [Bacteroidales bacterium]|nr:SDR family NAD(P)-dependent oxidoreductase [Bacteroidales bacterium]
NVVITGGASGIGRLIGRIAIEKGARSVTIWDINQSNIDIVSAEHLALARVVNAARTGAGCNASSRDTGSSDTATTAVYGFRTDVSDNDSVLAAYAETVKAAGRVDILVNCAGIVTSNKPFAQNTVGEIERTLKVNTLAPMLVSLAVINDMIARDHGHICTIASAAGMLSNPNMSAYAASKWGAIGWSDSVRIELAKAGSRVRITTVAPYYINTGMFDGVRSRIIPILKPDKTAAKIVKAIERNKDFRGIPFSFHFIRFWQGVLPVWLFDWFFGEVFGVYHTMDHFTGRKPAQP